MKFEDKPGEGTFWAGKNAEKGGPQHSGFVIADQDIAAGERIKLDLWPRVRKNEGSPTFGVSINRWVPNKKDDVPF